MRSRFRSLAHVALLALVAVVAPGCPTNKKLTPPVLVSTVPNHLDSGIGVSPNIIFKFDRAMDPAFITPTYFKFYLHNTTTTVPFTVENLPALNQVRIMPTGLLALNQAYDVFAVGQIQSAAGTAMGSNEGLTFTTQITTTTTSQMSFGTPTAAATANPGELQITWTKATESGPIDVPNYDIYVSTVQGGEDLTIAPMFTSTSLTGGLFTAAAATTYYIKVQPRDSSTSVLLPLVEIGPVTTN